MITDLQCAVIDACLLHPALLHGSLRADVVGGTPCLHGPDPVVTGQIRDDRLQSLRGIALSPEFRGDTDPDLHTALFRIVIIGTDCPDDALPRLDGPAKEGGVFIAFDEVPDGLPGFSLCRIRIPPGIGVHSLVCSEVAVQVFRIFPDMRP